MVWDEEKQPAGPMDRQPGRSTAQEKLAATEMGISPKDYPGSEEQEYNGVAVSQDSGVVARTLQKLRDFEALLDRKLGVESEAIDRKLPEERVQVSLWQSLTMATLWASGVLNISCFATGFIGWELGLNLKQNLLLCVFGSLLGGAVSGFCATLGPGTGLRQISIGRYSMGWWPNRIIAALNTIQQLGWSATACITGGLALEAVSNGSVSIVVGIIIIAIFSMLVSFVGLRAILVYERYAWLAYAVIFIIIYAMTGPYADTHMPNPLAGLELSGTALTMFAIVYGSSASWATIASDYYVHYPVDTSRLKVFILTTLGIGLPTAFGQCAGAVVASALNYKEDWVAAYDDGIGYLIQDMLHPRAFAKFLLVILVLSGINCNILNTYSAAISCQQFSRPFSKVPRFIWTLVCFVAIVALALAGRNSLLTYLEDFLSILGYWCTTYFVIVFSEHYFFRKNNFANYDLEAWNDPARLPHGIAGFTAFMLGVAAWLCGMDETWFVGPLAQLLDGGDLGNEFAFVVSALTYTPVRYLELKYFGR